MTPAVIIEQATAKDLNRSVTALATKPQAPRHRYRSSVEQSAEGDETALCYHSAPSVSAPLPQPLHAVALHGYA